MFRHYPCVGANREEEQMHVLSNAMTRDGAVRPASEARV